MFLRRITVVAVFGLRKHFSAILYVDEVYYLSRLIKKIANLLNPNCFSDRINQLRGFIFLL